MFSAGRVRHVMDCACAVRVIYGVARLQQRALVKWIYAQLVRLRLRPLMGLRRLALQGRVVAQWPTGIISTRRKLLPVQPVYTLLLAVLTLNS